MHTPSSPDDAEEADETLMRLYAGGDVGAFDTLYGRHALAVWRFVFRSIKVQAVADAKNMHTTCASHVGP